MKMTIDNGSDRLRVSCVCDKASLLMIAKKLGDITSGLTGLCQRFFKKGLFMMLMLICP